MTFPVEGKKCEICGRDAKVELTLHHNIKHYFCSLKCYSKWKRSKAGCKKGK
jgi:hypothetical protein